MRCDLFVVALVFISYVSTCTAFHEHGAGVLVQSQPLIHTPQHRAAIEARHVSQLCSALTGASIAPPVSSGHTSDVLSRFSAVDAVSPPTAALCVLATGGEGLLADALAAAADAAHLRAAAFSIDGPVVEPDFARAVQSQVGRVVGEESVWVSEPRVLRCDAQDAQSVAHALTQAGVATRVAEASLSDCPSIVVDDDGSTFSLGSEVCRLVSRRCKHASLTWAFFQVDRRVLEDVMSLLSLPAAIQSMEGRTVFVVSTPSLQVRACRAAMLASRVMSHWLCPRSCLELRGWPRRCRRVSCEYVHPGCLTVPGGTPHWCDCLCVQAHAALKRRAVAGRAVSVVAMPTPAPRWASGSQRRLGTLGVAVV